MEWVTDLPRRYTNELFVRSTINIVGIQSAISLLLVGFFAFGVSYASVAPIKFVGIILNPVPLVCLLSILIAVLFGLVIARVTLRPAKSSLEMQKLFISNIAHELRTPLSVIRTVSEVELLEEGLPKEQRKTITTILEEVDRASGVINNLLSLNRLLRPQHTEHAPVDLAPIVDRVVARNGKMAFERGIEIIVSKGDSTVVSGNSVALEQMIINLTNNALQYTPKNARGRVTISIRNDIDNQVMFSVADNGIGIAKEDLSHILEPFYRGDKSRARNIKNAGSGLGLAIVNEIVRAHRGTIRINSTQGKGTVVTIHLPKGHRD